MVCIVFWCFIRKDKHLDPLTMYKLVVICALVAAASADVSHLLRPGARPPAPSHHHHHAGADAQAAVVRQSFDISPEGSYQYAYDTDNGISANEQGNIRVLGADQTDKEVQGAFSYTSPEGEQVQVSYVVTADGGFQAQGSHVPVPPPVPAAIQRALEYIAAHPQPEDNAHVPNRRLF